MRINSTYLLCAGILAGPLAILGLNVVHAVPQCDGSVTKSELCGTATPCSNTGYTTTPPTCTGHQIIQQSAQTGCTDPTGSGSTKCQTEAGGTAVVCTKRTPCQLQTATGDGGITLYRCGTQVQNDVNNSTKVPSDLVTCTEGG